MADMDEVRHYALKVWQAKQGEMVSLMIEIGGRLGLFEALAQQQSSSPEGLSAQTGLRERALREWLLGMAAADLLVHEDGRFALPDAAGPVLVDELNSLFFAAGVFRGSFPDAVIGAIVDMFHSGKGTDFDAFGDEFAEVVERLSGPFNRLALVPMILPQLPGVADRLGTGGRVADVGGGAGVAAEAIARAFPNAHVVVVDPSDRALNRGRVRAGGVPNLEFRQGKAEELDDGPYELLLALDSLHDMPRPDLALAAMKTQLAPDGTVLVKELRSSGDFEKDRRNPLQAMFYGFSLMSCLLSGTSTDDGWGLGNTGLHPEALTALAGQHGFGNVRQLEVPDPGNLYFSLTE